MQISDIGTSAGIVYHYTTLASALGIIAKDGIRFHASRYDMMNDPNDSLYALSHFNHRLIEDGLNGLIDAFDANFSSYVVSFCKSKDNPLMWRLYNAEVFLHIDSDIIKEYCTGKTSIMHMNNVQYNEDNPLCSRARSIFFDCLNIPQGKSEKTLEAKALLSFIKHPDFAVENEWRIACFDDFDLAEDTCDKIIEADEICSELKTKGIKYGGICLYREMRFPKSCLKGVTFRTSKRNAFTTLCDQFRLWLSQCGYDVNNIDFDLTEISPVR